MNYIAKTILEILEERFKDDKYYLSEKKEELSKFKTKEETLTYLFTKLDENIQQKVVAKLSENGKWNEDEIEEIVHYSQKLFRMI